MRYFSLWTISVFLNLAGVAHSDCLVCDEVVEVNAARAECFVGNYERIAAAVMNAPNGRMPIDFDECTVGGEKISERGGVAVLPRLEGQPGINQGMVNAVKSVYLLDTKSIECLKVLVETHPGPLDPLATFDLFEQC